MTEQFVWPAPMLLDVTWWCRTLAVISGRLTVEVIMGWFAAPGQTAPQRVSRRVGEFARSGPGAGGRCGAPGG